MKRTIAEQLDAAESGEELTTRSGFKLQLEDAGFDREGNQLWRQVAATLGGAQ